MAGAEAEDPELNRTGQAASPHGQRSASRRRALLLASGVACGLAAFVGWRLVAGDGGARNRTGEGATGLDTTREPTLTQTQLRLQQPPAVERGSKPPSPPPVFVPVDDSRPALQVVPGAPGYDPTKFGGLISIGKVFEAEPRNESWARPVEEHMQRRLERDLGSIAPQVTTKVECRTTTCRWTWTGPAESDEAVRWAQRMLYMGSVVARTGKNELTAAYYGGGLGFKGLAMGDAAGLIERMEQRRAALLRAIHEGRRAHLDEFIPRSAWPKD